MNSIPELIQHIKLSIRNAEKEISKLDIGGYAECEVIYSDKGEFIIYYGTYAIDSIVSIVDTQLSRDLNFYDSYGKVEDKEMREILIDFIWLYLWISHQLIDITQYLLKFFISHYSSPLSFLNLFKSNLDLSSLETASCKEGFSFSFIFFILF